MVNLEKLKTELHRLKIFLIAITIPLGGLFLWVFFGDFGPFIIKHYHKIWGIAAFINYAGIAIFIWYIWKRYPVENSKKRKDILMIICLGIIGVWIWMPNKKEIGKLIES